MRQLRTLNETNIAANFLSDSTWNPGDFRWIFQRPRHALDPCNLIAKAPREHTNSKDDWAWVLRERAHGNGPRSGRSKKVVAGTESTASVPVL